MGGLISALYTFTRNGLGETLFRFTTDKHQYYIIEQNNLLFAGKFSRNTSLQEKEILKGLKKIRKRFFRRYSHEDIKNWDHDINKFIAFQYDIKTKKEL